MYVQYGQRVELCEMLMGNSTKTMDEQMTEVYNLGVGKGVSYNQYYRVALQNTTIDVNNNMRQWTWQYCTEFGYF